MVGLAGGGEHLLGFVDIARGRVGLEISRLGTTAVLAERRVRGRVRRMAFVLCENQPTVLVDSGNGWRAAVTERHRVGMRVDLRRPETLERLRPAWGVLDGTAEVGPVRGGIFGMAGLRDLHLVQHADGTPYEGPDGRWYLTATCAGLGYFTQAHWGVFAFDPTALGRAGRLEQTAHLFSRRDGLVLGDHAGQLVRDDGRWLVGVSSWGDFEARRGVHARHTTTDADLLHGVHLLDTERTPLPSEVSTWDPGMTRVDGRWRVTYVESPSQDPFEFRPALAVGPEGARDWTEGLAPVGVDASLAQAEGPVQAPLDPDGGKWRVLASDGDGRRYPVYDLAMKRLGHLDAPYGSNIPHPQVLALPDGDLAIVSFDGTAFERRRLGYGTHGDVVVMRARR